MKRKLPKLGAALLTGAIVCGLGLTGTAMAAEAAEISTTGNKIAGAFAGVVLAGLLIYALYAAARPLIEARDRGFKRAMLVLLALWIVKTVALVFCAGYPIDVGTYEAWARQISDGGPMSMYQTGFFLDYPPGYLYALWAAGSFVNLVGASSYTAMRVIVETAALAADFLLAALMFAFVRRSRQEATAWAAMLFVALNPALLFDTVGWGRTDSALALVLLLSVVTMIDEEVELAWGLAALGLLIKPQTIMLLPVLGLWTLLKCDFSRW